MGTTALVETIEPTWKSLMGMMR